MQVILERKKKMKETHKLWRNNE